MASRGVSGVLESTSLTSLNAIHGIPAQPRKRKISQIDADGPVETIISIKGHASSLSDNNEFNLAPIELLPRSDLPFTWLDSTTAVQSGNIFISNNELLEEIFSGTSGEEPLVLAARLASSGALYVVEQIKKRIYALTKLQPHIDEGEVRVTAKRARFWNSVARPAPGAADWREAAKVQDPGDDNHGGFLKKTKLDVFVSFGNTSSSNHASAQNQEDQLFVSELQAYVHAPAEDNVQLPLPEDEATLSAEAILDNLRVQYLEALYISKTSVAYFAKGPLTRTRNTFQNSSPEGSGCSDLLAFYRESILSVKKMDTKYREGLPTILQSMVLVLSEDERPKKRRSRKKKLGKNGLYPGEDEFIKKCWRSRQLTERGGQQAELSKDEEIKRHVSELRLRETQLQILLILEAIFLKNTIVSSGQDGNAKDDNASGTKREKSTKKGEDLNVLLELLLDRLCIWHAVSAAESVVAESVGDKADSHLSGKKIESDALRDFCNEVIIPFYASRLPEQCKSIKKKLGGVAERSPSHPTPESRNSSKTQQAGISDKRTQALKPPRRTLQRVLTDEQAAAASQRSRHPSLRRSSTTPALQEARAESMEPSLPSLGSSVRGGIQAARRVDKREVDLNAVAKQHETKIKKMGMLIEQKKELDAAISALRKPNRELVAKELADQAERRTTTTSARKPKNPVRNPYGQGVQVMATPKASRRRDVNNAGLLPPPRGLSSRRSGGKDLGTSPALGSDVSLVPQSSVVRSTISRTVTRREVNAIDETPSRGTSKLLDPLGNMSDMAVETPNTTQYSRTLFKVPTLPPAVPTTATAATSETTTTAQSIYDQDHEISTPVPKRKSMNMIYNNDDLRIPEVAIHETPPRSGKLPAAMIPSSPAGASLIETPVKRAVGHREIVESTPEKSIYEQLGWDDDDLAL
ncbi:Stress response protein NST1 [Talaromyces islandicus]|uniref:Stress response protein NST1 n=1 Tax=Talaromyces islandicus TaxID=28573 RepID=A0A0U1LPA3_TALIS|nr:Stress response protein NST1 [Talaromyces islandicus]